MKYLSDFIWLLSARSSWIVSGVACSILAMVGLNDGYSIGQFANSQHVEADLKTNAARQAALERTALFVDKGARHVQPEETGVAKRGIGHFGKTKDAVKKPSSRAAPEFLRNKNLGGVLLGRPKDPPPQLIDVVRRADASRF